MNPLTELKDIHGLDPISWWPLAMGWWFLVGLFAVTLIFAASVDARRRRKVRKWNHDALTRLMHMEKSLKPENSQQMATRLSELVRRIAVHTYSRQECASLEGETWLKWLTEKDSKRFNWSRISHFLIEAPFSGPGRAVDSEAVIKTIRAAKEWVK